MFLCEDDSGLTKIRIFPSSKKYLQECVEHWFCFRVRYLEELNSKAVWAWRFLFGKVRGILQIQY